MKCWYITKKILTYAKKESYDIDLNFILYTCLNHIYSTTYMSKYVCMQIWLYLTQGYNMNFRDN